MIYVFFWFFFRQGMPVPSFIILGYVCQVLRIESTLPILEQFQKVPSFVGLMTNYKAFVKITSNSDVICNKGWQQKLS